MCWKCDTDRKTSFIQRRSLECQEKHNDYTHYTSSSEESAKLKGDFFVYKKIKTSFDKSINALSSEYPHKEFFRNCIPNVFAIYTSDKPQF